MTVLEPEQFVTIGAWDVTIISHLCGDERTASYLAETADGHRVLVWVGTDEWARGTEKMLRAYREGLPRVIEVDRDGDRATLLLEGLGADALRAMYRDTVVRLNTISSVPPFPSPSP